MKNNNEISNFLEGLLELGKELENQLKTYSNNNNSLKELFSNLTKEIDNSVKETDETPNKNINICDKVNNINKLDNSHIEMKEDNEKYEYIFTESFKRPYVDIIAILKKKLSDFTFAACTDTKDYVLNFTFGDVHYTFNWDKTILHFIGSTDDDDFEIECEPFYFDEVDNSFKEIDEKDASSEETNICDGNKCCEVECEDKCCETEKKEDLGQWNADILFKTINEDANKCIEEELLPIIKIGVDRVLAYKLYTTERSSNSKYFDIVVFSLEDVQLNCEEFIRTFWDIISYERLVKFFVDTYGFKKVFILEKEENNKTIHEVRCFLK